jgi:general secretion pathway protein G
MRKAFTAIELMIVVAILMLLAGILVPVVSGIRARAKLKLAKSKMTAMALAIDQFRLTEGRYPVSTDVQPTSLYDALHSGYMDFAKDELKAEGESFVVVDPWGNPWIYKEYYSEFNRKMTKAEYEDKLRALKPHHPMSFDLYSWGPDEQLDPLNNGVDDAIGTEPPNGKVDESDELVDDITNW